MSEMTDEKRNFFLSELAYVQLFDTNEKSAKYENKYTLGKLVKNLTHSDVKYDGALTSKDVDNLFKEIQSDSKLRNLTFTNYENNNASGSWDGFVAYSFKDSSNNAYFAFRGSESDTPEGQHDGMLGADWIDNYRMGVEGKSKQFEDVKSFVKDNSSGSPKIYVTGHSKGGANALYACSQFKNAKGMAFDAPGIGEALSEEEIQNLRNSGAINYVAADDKVGALESHPENRMFCQMNKTYSLYLDSKNRKVTNYNEAEGESFGTDMFVPHAMEALKWGNDGRLILAQRSGLSQFTEFVTQSAYNYNKAHSDILDIGLEWVIKNKKDLLGGVNKDPLIIPYGVAVLEDSVPYIGEQVVEDYVDPVMKNIGESIFDKEEALLDDVKDGIEDDLEEVEGGFEEIEDGTDCVEAGAEDALSDIDSYFLEGVATGSGVVAYSGEEFNCAAATIADGIIAGATSIGASRVAGGTGIKLDINSLRAYASKMEMLKRRASDIERRINALYFDPDIDFSRNILKLLKTSFLEFGMDNFTSAIDYLNNTANVFQNAEAKLNAMANELGV